MAIRLTSAALSKPFSYICMCDEAVDVERKTFADEWKAYREGLGEPPLKDGLKPTVWELTPITDAVHQAELGSVLSRQEKTSWLVAYAARGITGVENLATESGEEFVIKRENNDGYMTVRRSQLAQIPLQVLTEIGRVLIEHNYPNED